MSTTLHPMDNNETDPKKGSCTIMGRNYRFNGQPNTADTVVKMWHAPSASQSCQTRLENVLCENLIELILEQIFLSDNFYYVV